MTQLIKLKNRETIKRYEIADIITGKPTGEYLEFDTEDITNATRWNECMEEHKKNKQWLKMQLTILEKKEDKKGKKILSYKEEETAKLMTEYYKKEATTLDMFLGEKGCEKLLNGRNYYYSMFDDIAEVVSLILPDLEDGFKNVEKRIKEKYSEATKRNTLE